MTNLPSFLFDMVHIRIGQDTVKTNILTNIYEHLLKKDAFIVY